MKSPRLEVFFHIEPDVPAFLADSEDVALEFEDWSGDHIIACSPYFFASETILALMVNSGVSGFSYSKINSKQTEKFSSLSSFATVPEFALLRIEGIISELPRTLRLVNWSKEHSWSGHDVCLGPKNELVFSQRCLNAISIECIPNARIKTVGVFVSD